MAATSYILCVVFFPIMSSSCYHRHMKRSSRVFLSLCYSLFVIQSLFAANDLGLTEANLFGSAVPNVVDAGGGSNPNPNTPCLSGSCTLLSTSDYNWAAFDIACIALVAPPNMDYTQWKETVSKYECVAQGYPGYVYSYVCTQSKIHNCLTDLGPKDQCPSGGCAQ